MCISNKTLQKSAEGKHAMSKPQNKYVFYNKQNDAKGKTNSMFWASRMI